jgi:hypothetical protein
LLQKKTAAVKIAFEQELGLVVDRKRDGGFGNTNTGNVVRKTFDNAEKMLPYVVSQQCWFQTLLHIAYKQDIKIFKVRNPEEK